jgi:hypothetical protein
MKAFFALLLIAFGAISVRVNACFDDKHLQSLHSDAQQRGTLVYVWSPRMVYSVDNVAMASRAAAVAGLDFVVLHDARVPSAEISQTQAMSAAAASAGSQVPDRRLANLHSQRPVTTDVDLATPPFVSPLHMSRPLCSDQLIRAEALRHFPTAFVITKQGMHAHPIVGAMPIGAWISSIEQRLSGL